MPAGSRVEDAVRNMRVKQPEGTGHLHVTLRTRHPGSLLMLPFILHSPATTEEATPPVEAQ